MNPSTHRSPATTAASGRCPRCGHAFDCAMRAAGVTTAAGQQSDTPPCWCRAMPPLPAERLVPGRACLCPECLADEIARAQTASDTPGPVR